MSFQSLKVKQKNMSQTLIITYNCTHYKSLKYMHCNGRLQRRLNNCLEKYQSSFDAYQVCFQCRLGISKESWWNNWSVKPGHSHTVWAELVRSMSVEELWVRRADQRSPVVATQGASHHQQGQRSSRNQLRNSWQTPKLQSGWSFRTLGLAEFWCEALTAASAYVLNAKAGLGVQMGFFKSFVATRMQKSWNGTAGMGWHLSQQTSLPQINATLLGSQPLHTLAGWKGEDSVPATSGPPLPAFHANAEKIHMPLSLHPNHFREAERKVMKEKVREGKPGRQGKRGRGRE